MKVAFVNRDRTMWPGGDLIMMDETIKALEAKGVEARHVPGDMACLLEFDLVHLIHCNFDWSLKNYEAIRASGKPYVLTPMYYPEQPRLRTKEIVDNTAFLLPFSNREKDELLADVPTTTAVRVIPCGTDPMFHSHYPYRVGVMCVSARGKSEKNVEMVERICRRLKVGFTLPSPVDFSRGRLAYEYSGKQVFVNASASERMSLTIGEALCANCRVLATDKNRGNEWYPGLVTFDPGNEIQLEHLIRLALNAKDWDYRPNVAARCLTWDWVAGKLLQVYQEALK